ncbi:class I SAM-dependent methyltransferase [Prauserella flavalba]|uniref:Methyltransferase MycE N-terminal domain-containing protein n=1 Tax=Prauserella flavalba TaxID=1477506 RepID=A0A318LVD0_9PSEU|nr:class I SAM-dependent methyltransferase [Prauserella flavalba]PXY36308.1 hypothetical protein BA062_12895 [Prauserella flavalba]
MTVSPPRSGDVRALLTVTEPGHVADEELLALGTGRVARTALGELLHRARLSDLAGTRVTVEFRWGCGTEEVVLCLVVESGKAEIAEHPREAPGAIVTQRLAEVVLALYGPADPVPAATRELHWPGAELLRPGAARGTEFAIVHRLLAALDRRDRPGLAELAVRHGSDKWGPHQYTRHYERHFAPLRDRRLTVLEVGIGGYGDPAEGGASLRMWRDYFPRAEVYGVDLWDKSALDGPRLTTVRADQSDRASLSAVAERHGPFDIVIDDGSHVSALTLATFEALFPHVRAGGLYAIEDVQTSYWPVFGGNGTDLADPGTTMGFAKDLLDGLNHTELLDSHGRAPRPTDAELAGIHFYRNLIVLEKGVNTGQSPIADELNARLRRSGS